MSRRFVVPRSKLIAGIEWLGNRVTYQEKQNDEEVKGDTFPMTWAADDEIYTSAGDPIWGQSRWGLDIEKFSGYPPDYRISKVNDMIDYTGWAGKGPKPTGMISVKGSLYFAYQNALNHKPPVYGSKSQHGSDSVIARSDDFGKTWKPDIKSIGLNPTFRGFRFGGPAFVNFGKDNAGARDEYVYAVSTDQWDNGGHLVLGRAHQDHIVEAAAWEWVCEIDENNVPAWTRELDKAVAVLSDDRWISLPEMVYLKAIKRYLLLTWRLNADFAAEGSRLIVYESPEPWGPFSLAHYEEVWEEKDVNPYCPRIPLKWMESDGISGWLQFSGCWVKTPERGQPYYRSHVRKFRLRMAP